VIGVALKTPLKNKIGNLYLPTSLTHRADNCIGFTSSCPPHILQQNCAHEYNPQIFVLCNRFCTLSNQCQQRNDCAFCTLSLRSYANSFAAGESNSMLFCISLTQTHIWYTLQPMYTWTKHINIISKHQAVHSIRLHQYDTQLQCCLVQ